MDKYPFQTFQRCINNPHIPTNFSMAIMCAIICVVDKQTRHDQRFKSFSQLGDAVHIKLNAHKANSPDAKRDLQDRKEFLNAVLTALHAYEKLTKTRNLRLQEKKMAASKPKIESSDFLVEA